MHCRNESPSGEVPDLSLAYLKKVVTYAKNAFICSQQEALLEDLRTDIPVNFNFLFSDSHVEVISGKQEGKINL